LSLSHPQRFTAARAHHQDGGWDLERWGGPLQALDQKMKKNLFVFSASFLIDEERRRRR